MNFILKAIKRKKFKKEFENKCLHTFPCQTCAWFRFRGKYKNKCELGEKLLEKYGLDEEIVYSNKRGSRNAKNKI